MPYGFQVLSAQGAAAAAVTVAGTGAAPVSVPVPGELVAASAPSFTPMGSGLDAVPPFSFRVPLAEWRNQAADIGAQIRLTDLDTAVEVAKGPVTAINRTVDASGAAWAQVSCDDQMQELVRESATLGFATDPGYTNRGAASPFSAASPDPTPSRAAETLNTTLLRLRNLSLGSLWTIANADVTGFDGVPFTASGRGLLQAILDFAQARFAHIKRGGDRVLLFGHFGASSGLRIEQSPPDATATLEASANAPLAIIGTPSFKTDGHIANSVTPVGSGSGTSQLTLRPLYNATGETVVLTADGRDIGMRQSGAVAFTGYNPAHPIRKRPTADPNASFDGYDYFIEDDASVSLYGRWTGTETESGIAFATNSAGGVSAVDEQAAAASLYTVADAKLRWSALPRTEIAVATIARGDLTGLGGLTLHVRYSGVAENVTDPTQPLREVIGIDADYVVQNLVVTEDAAGGQTAQWTLTTNGQYVTSTTGLLLGAMDQAVQLGTAIPTVGTPIYRQKAQNIGPTADLVMQFRADNAVARTHYMIGYLSLEGMVHTRAEDTAGHVHDVLTAQIPHDVNALPADTTNLPLDLNQIAIDVGSLKHDVAALKHDVDPLLHNVNSRAVDLNALGLRFLIGGVTVSSVDFDPSNTLTLGGSPPSGVSPLVTDGTSIFRQDGRGGTIKGGAFSATHFGITSGSVPVTTNAGATVATTDGTGGKTVATANGTGGKTVATGSGTGGQTVKTLNGATARSTGNTNIALVSGTRSGATVQATSGGTAGTTVETTHLAVQGKGAKGATATQESVYRGPNPTGVTVWVDNVQRFGPFDSAPGPLDFTPWMGDQGAHEIRVKSPTNGAAELEIEGLRDRAPLAVRPTG